MPGGIQGDFERLGVQTSSRRSLRLAEEFIEACRLLWREPESVSFQGETFQLNGALVSPGPAAIHSGIWAAHPTLPWASPPAKPTGC